MPVGTVLRYKSTLDMNAKVEIQGLIASTTSGWRRGSQLDRTSVVSASAAVAVNGRHKEVSRKVSYSETHVTVAGGI